MRISRIFLLASANACILLASANEANNFLQSNMRPTLRAQSISQCNITTPCSNEPYYVCEDGQCFHKSVFPIEGPEWGAYILLTFLMALCNVAGIGGGAIDQPFYQGLFRFTIKEGIAISSLVIFMAAVARYIYTLSHKNPNKPYTVSVDYSLATIMISTTLAGSQMGSKLFLATFPPLVVQILFQVLLVGLAVQSLFKARQIQQKEAKEDKEAKDKIDDEAKKEVIASDGRASTEGSNDLVGVVDTPPGVSIDPENIPASNFDAQVAIDTEYEPQVVIDTEANIVRVTDSPTVESPKIVLVTVEINGQTFQFGKSTPEDKELKALQALAKRESGHCQWVKQLICLSLIGLLILVNLFIGSSKSPSIVGIDNCGGFAWGIQGAFVIFCGFVTWWTVRYNKRE